MGWTVLYIAFGIVALWLLGEVLLQYKARLRWRVLAFTGFLCVVAGALIPSVLVIGVGIAAFATGQTFVTLSYRRGFVAGWALTGVPGVSRRREEREPEPQPELDAGPRFDEVEAPQPVPALTASGGFGAEGGRLGMEPNGFDTASFAAVDSMGAPSGYGGPNRYDTGGFPAVDMSAPPGFPAPNGNGYDSPVPSGNRYDNPNGNANGYETAGFPGVDAFAGADAFGGPGGPGVPGGPGGFEATQAFSSETEGYQTGSFPPPNGFGPQDLGPQGFGPQDNLQQQVPVYQPGPLPEEITGEFTLGGGYDGLGGYPGAGAGQQPGIYQDGNAPQQYGGYSDPYAAFESNGMAPGGPAYGGYDSMGGGYDTYGGGYGGYGVPGDPQGYGPQQSPYGVSDTFGGGGGLGAMGAGADAYGSMYGNGETYADGQPYFPQAPTGGAGAWVPQQRDPNEQQQQGYPYQQNGDPYGYGAQGNGYGPQGNSYGGQGNGYGAGNGYGPGNGYYY